MHVRRSLVGLLAGVCLVAAPAGAETLKEALTRAYVDNPTLAAARAQQRATDENVVIQRAQGLPSASASGTYQEFIVPNSASFIAPSRSLGAQVDLSVPLYSGGAIRNGILAADTRVEAGRADLDRKSVV